MAGLMGKLKEHVQKNRKGGPTAKTMPYKPRGKGSEKPKAKTMPYKPSTRPGRPGDDEDGPLKKLRFGNMGHNSDTGGPY